MPPQVPTTSQTRVISSGVNCRPQNCLIFAARSMPLLLCYHSIAEQWENVQKKMNIDKIIR
jgi:hypothetical protein